MDTIFALASAQGKAGVSVIRVSGPAAFDVGSALCGASLPQRGMVVRTLRSEDGEEVDRALVLTFQAPHSFTGENTVELQVHGSPAVVARVLSVLSNNQDCRLALPGEFTRRALDNGQLDLAQVEGLADLINAETEFQRKQALSVFSGDVGQRVEGWRDRLIRALSLVEVSIDFADEDVPEDVTDDVRDLLDGLRADFQSASQGVEVAERLRTGFEVAIVGSPNAGKSTLLNYLAGRDAAITSEIAGTTRDIIEVQMDLKGLPVTILDTAGLRETDDKIEGLGVERAKTRAMAADLRVVLLQDGEPVLIDLEEDDLTLTAKCDLTGGKGVSGLTGEGVDTLVDHIVAVLNKRVGNVSGATRIRHRVALDTADHELSLALGFLKDGAEFYDICAEHMRRSLIALESLIGRFDVESVLDEIFSSFCLGK